MSLTVLEKRYEIVHTEKRSVLLIGLVLFWQATEAFSEIHPEDVIKRTITGDDMKFAFKGEIDASTVPADAKAKSSQGHGGEEEVEVVGKPPVEAMINVFDFEAIAQREMLGSGKKEGWAYYSSGGDDEITLRENHNAFHRCSFLLTFCCNGYISRSFCVLFSY
jgi:hypothetical protein